MLGRRCLFKWCTLPEPCYEIGSIPNVLVIHVTLEYLFQAMSGKLIYTESINIRMGWEHISSDWLINERRMGQTSQNVGMVGGRIIRIYSYNVTKFIEPKSTWGSRAGRRARTFNSCPKAPDFLINVGWCVCYLGFDFYTSTASRGSRSFP